MQVEDLQKIIIECVNSCLKQNKESSLIQHNSDRWFNLNELIEYLPDKPAKTTVYSWIHHSLIPFHKKLKTLFFLKSEIDFWLKEGRKRTAKEISLEADKYLAN